MLLVVFGPPAVGKMTVGRALAESGRFRLFHNHMTIEPLLETFGFGTPPFNTLNSEFRRRVLEEAAVHGIDLVFTVVWALDSEDDHAVMASYVEIFDGDVAFVELRADLDTRLARNRTEARLAHKASKRDLDWSDANVRDMEGQWAMTSADDTHAAADLLARHRHLVLETTDLSAHDCAARVLAWLDQVT
ncbi:AAA family ATPase [Propioniciclava soli]|uniref:AAA family ATPase n=1 Tax=Propioniciclava soli TaxID=2775081 RepID=A0ABZ3CBJ9_9ACTN